MAQTLQRLCEAFAPVQWSPSAALRLVNGDGRIQRQCDVGQAPWAGMTVPR